jgi:hypothetical protein
MHPADPRDAGFLFISNTFLRIQWNFNADGALVLAGNTRNLPSVHEFADMPDSSGEL